MTTECGPYSYHCIRSILRPNCYW